MTELTETEQIEFLKKAGQESFISFCEIIDSNYKATWFHEHLACKLQSAIEKVMNGEKVRLIITVPPRHGKSQLSSIFLPAWALGKFPKIKFILSSYGQSLSETMGLKTRDVISSTEYQTIFPTVKLRQDQQAKAKWMTAEGGSYLSVGVGTGVTGHGANVILIDDPLRDRADAESKTMQDNVWEYYRSTLYTRLEGTGGVIVIMQRWNNNDLVARLLEEEEKMKGSSEPHDNWEVVNFPAIATEDEYDGEVLLRKEGEPLWPEKFPLMVLRNIKQTQGMYNFISQYQQKPIASETQEFKERMFKTYKPEDLAAKYLKYYTFVDPAISQEKTADNTVVVTIGKEVNGPNIYRIREDAGKFTPTQTVDLIFKHAEEYNSIVGIEVQQYQMALKYAVQEEQRKRQMYFTIREIRQRAQKEVRIRGLIPLYDAGVIWHMPNDFEYESEALQFPRGKHDDRLDAMAMMLTEVHKTGRGRAKQVKPKWSGYGRRV